MRVSCVRLLHRVIHGFVVPATFYEIATLILLASVVGLGGLPLRQLTNAKAVVSAIPHSMAALSSTDPRLALIHELHSLGYTGHVAVAMHTPTDADLLRIHGVELILTPFSDAADFAVTALEKVLKDGGATLSTLNGQPTLRRF